MNGGSPLESRYIAPASTAASTTGRPTFTNGPAVDTSTSPAPISSRRLPGPAAAPATAVSSWAPASCDKLAAKAASRSRLRPARTGRVPPATIARAVSPPMYPVAPYSTIRPGIPSTYLPPPDPALGPSGQATVTETHGRQTGGRQTGAGRRAGDSSVPRPGRPLRPVG